MESDISDCCICVFILFFINLNENRLFTVYIGTKHIFNNEGEFSHDGESGKWRVLSWYNVNVPMHLFAIWPISRFFFHLIFSTILSE